MPFEAERNAIRHLLDEKNPADAIAVYYALYHPAQKTQLVTYPTNAKRAAGYIAVSRTGVDLFRPLVTMRLPDEHAHDAAENMFAALSEGTPAILYTPVEYEPLLQAFFEIQTAEQFQLLILDRQRYQPVINIHVTQSSAANGLPRYVISSPQDRSQVGANSGLNWQTPNFAELFVNTSPGQRRQGWGRSVLAAMVQHVLDSGRTPLYVASTQNDSSQRLAESVGFIDSGKVLSFAQAVRRKAY
jgi:RimJ/RimL family protein N-acetyltransferase